MTCSRGESTVAGHNRFDSDVCRLRKSFWLNGFDMWNTEERKQWRLQRMLQSYVEMKNAQIEAKRMEDRAVAAFEFARECYLTTRDALASNSDAKASGRKLPG